MSPVKCAQEGVQVEKETNHRMTLESGGETHHQSRPKAQPVVEEQREMGGCSGRQLRTPVKKAEVMLRSDETGGFWSLESLRPAK